MTDIDPLKGQHFTLQPVQPKPKPAMSWGLPLASGLLAIPLLMFGFGFSQQQTPPPAANAPATPTSEQANSLNVPTPTTEAAPTQTPTPPAEATPKLGDVARFPIARIQSPGVAANFRAAPTLQSQVLGVLLQGDLVELTPDRRVQQDGVTWVPVRWRSQSGWLASNFIGGSPNVQP